MIAFRAAQHCVLAGCAPLDVETVALGEAHGRVLGHDAYASDDLVPFARSAMDGFALRATETADRRVFPIQQAVYAQAAAPAAHVSGTATQIATGGALPYGADTVVALEDVAHRNGSIQLGGPLRSGQHVFPSGEDARRGERILEAGTSLEPAQLALLASAGFARVAVGRRPRVAILCTGNELVDVDEVPGHGQIRNSNATTARTIAAAAGAVIISEATVADDRHALRQALRNACADADLVITTGGASVGERDFVKGTLRDLGVSFTFESVAMRPGRPTAFGRLGAARVIVLPGNPAAAFVGLYEFAAPALARLQGSRRPCLPRVIARLDGTVHAKPNRTYLPFVRLRVGERLIATPLDNQCSALTRTAVQAHGLAYIEGGVGAYGAGSDVTVDVYRWPSAAHAEPA